MKMIFKLLLINKTSFSMLQQLISCSSSLHESYITSYHEAVIRIYLFFPLSERFKIYLKNKRNPTKNSRYDLILFIYIYIGLVMNIGGNRFPLTFNCPQTLPELSQVWFTFVRCSVSPGNLWTPSSDSGKCESSSLEIQNAERFFLYILNSEKIFQC